MKKAKKTRIAIRIDKDLKDRFIKKISQTNLYSSFSHFLRVKIEDFLKEKK